MSYSVSAVFQLKKQDDELLRGLVNALASKYVQNMKWQKNVSYDESFKYYSILLVGKGYEFELCLGYYDHSEMEECRGKKDVQLPIIGRLLEKKRPIYLEMSTPEFYLYPDNDGHENCTVMKNIFIDSFEFLKPIHGFSSHEITLANVYDLAYDNHIETARFFFGVSCYGTDLVKSLGLKKFKTVPYGKILESDTGIVYFIDDLGLFGGYPFTYTKKMQMTAASNRKAQMVAKHLGITWRCDL